MDPAVRLQHDFAQSIQLTPDKVKNSLRLKWTNTVPASRANKMFEMLGTPNNVEINPGGYVEWRNVDPLLSSTKVENGYSRLIIKDENIAHLVPVLHKDFFYAYIPLPIAEDKINKVLKISESISYDSLKKELCARCHLMLPNLVSLFMSKQVAQGDKSLAHARQEYGILITTMEENMMKKKIGIDLGKPSRLDITLLNYLFDLEMDVLGYPI